MKAMLLEKLTSLAENPQPLRLRELPAPEARRGEVRIRVAVCGVCHTELDEIEGRTPPTSLPMVLGHQVVGVVDQAPGPDSLYHEGDRVGVAWIFSSCGKCAYCLSGNENLCPDFQATGRDAPGGYAEYMTVPEGFAYPIPRALSDAQAAPLLCAGAVGYRALRLTGLINGQMLGLTGFGASGHLVLQMVKYSFPHSHVFVFARSPEEQSFARELGADWAGDTAAEPPQALDCMIDTTPVWKPVLEALRCLRPGGRLVINAIRKEDTGRSELLSLDYARHLWQEKEIKSVANVTRQDVREFLDLAAVIPLHAETQEFALEQANEALLEMKNRKIRGAKVLRVADGNYRTIA